MIFNYRFAGSTQVSSTASTTGLNFVPDTLRESVWFIGRLNKKIAFREAISALHDVVISDLQFKPKDKTAYKEWALQQEAVFLAEYMAAYDERAANDRMAAIQKELTLVSKEREKIMAPFYKARQRYFDYLYRNDRDAWFVLDPVISVHPDELFFECFSKDESTYGKLSCSYNVFDELNDFKCGTTNVDYSAGLYNEFQKIRDYKETELKIDPTGFTVATTSEDDFKEVKIDLPDSWVRGFLQVSSAMTLPAITLDIHPMDVHSICTLLRRFKEKHGPRALQYVLEPGKPVRILLEPWGKEIICHRSIFTGNAAHTIRTWGRRRLLVLERLIPVAQRFKIYLLGTGLPAFYMADMGDLQFTLGLSGWTNNNWSHAGNFDLLAPRREVANDVKQKVFAALEQKWSSPVADLALQLNIENAAVAGALSAYTQAGRVIFDLNKNLYRFRELSRQPLPVEQLRFSNPQEQQAATLLQQQDVKYKVSENSSGVLTLTGTLKAAKKTYNPVLEIDADERIVKAHCDCSFYVANKLYKGPCQHMLAVRQAFNASRLINTG
jgi:hypothetical protein